MATAKKQTKKAKTGPKGTTTDCGGMKPPKPLPKKKPKKKGS